MIVDSGFAVLMFIPLLAALICIGLSILFRGAAEIVKGMFGNA
jgi:hypothetical protein